MNNVPNTYWRLSWHWNWLWGSTEEPRMIGVVKAGTIRTRHLGPVSVVSITAYPMGA